DPVALLLKLAASLKKGGMVFVGLPFLENLPKWGFKGFFHIAHLHYFSIPYFIKLSRRNGLIALQKDRQHGHVLLQMNQISGCKEPCFRFYNGTLLALYGLPYLTFSYPARLAWKSMKQVPWLARPLGWVKETFL
ncbi:MAG: hypothetical protein ACRD47_15545, partial [Nitrososphaeraceae archaeon]